MASTSDIRNGMVIKFKNDLWEFVEFLHVKPGKGAAFVRSKLKNLKTGQVLDNTFRTSEKFEEVRVENTKKQYLYADSDFYVFMDNETYEQMSIAREQIGDKSCYLTEGMEVKIRLTPEQDIVGIELPVSVEMEIGECEPNVKGNTASASGKKAMTTSGLDMTVPFFIETGDKIKVDTRTGEYIERVK